MYKIAILLLLVLLGIICATPGSAQTTEPVAVEVSASPDMPAAQIISQQDTSTTEPTGEVVVTPPPFIPPVFSSPVSYNALPSESQKQIDCLADNIYFEARAEPPNSQMAVALVTINRVESGKFPNTICGVVKQKTRSVCQFSWWCSNSARLQSQLKTHREKDTYQRLREIATHVFRNYAKIPDITKGALFYHAAYVSRSALGLSGIRQTARIGQHIFYRIH